MPNITFIEANGQSTTLDVPEGWSLMQAATANGVEGILGECGGGVTGDFVRGDSRRYTQTSEML